MSRLAANDAADLPPALDVSHLPTNARDSRDPVWWGNTLMIFIETTTIALLIAAYFYIRRNFDEFPPPQVDRFPVVYHPMPDRLWGSLSAVLIILSCIPMYLTDMAARREERSGVLIGLASMFVIACLSIWLREQEFHHLTFHWNDNAYGSCVWGILGMHLTYLIGAALEFFIIAAWILRHRLDEHHVLDVTLAGGYWYWVAGTWAVCYALVYWGPRLMAT